jgi:hypothetical protein
MRPWHAAGELGGSAKLMHVTTMNTPLPAFTPATRASRPAAFWRAIAGGVCFWGVAWSTMSHAHDLTPCMGRPATERRHFQGNPFDRAGNPQCISPLAKSTESPHEEGYYVGGGARVKSRGGEERRHHEGTWGVDYTGILVHKKTNLGWWHGSRYQGGVGSYPTDGPRLVHRP